MMTPPMDEVVVGTVGETHHDTQERHAQVEEILRRVGDLPTLDCVAIRLLQLTADDGARIDEVIQLISWDPSLSTKVLRMCRRVRRPGACQVMTLQRAVPLLGFNAVRNAVLSVSIFEAFESAVIEGGESHSMDDRDAIIFDRRAFWHHCLAVGVISEMLAKQLSLRTTIDPGEAFVAGLLHDLGLLALHVILPRTLDRVCDLSLQRRMELGEACRRIVGIAPGSAGRCLAEHWDLPELLRDVSWLGPAEVIESTHLPHRDHLLIVQLANAIACERSVAPLGHRCGGTEPSVDLLRGALGVTPESIDLALKDLDLELAARTDGLGLRIEDASAAMLRSVTRANSTLGRLNEALHGRCAMLQRQSQDLSIIDAFLRHGASSVSPVTVAEEIARSAIQFEGVDEACVALRSEPSAGWTVRVALADGTVEAMSFSPGADSHALCRGFAERGDRPPCTPTPLPMAAGHEGWVIIPATPHDVSLDEHGPVIRAWSAVASTALGLWKEARSMIAWSEQTTLKEKECNP